MSDKLEDKPLSELSAIRSALELEKSDLILISKMNDGEHKNFLSRNMEIGAFETFTMSYYVNPALSSISTDLYNQTEECSSFLSNVISNDIVHKKDANFSLICPGTGYVTAVLQENGVLSAIASDLETDLNVSQYCKKKDLNNNAGRDGYYMAGFRQTNGYVTATLSGFAPILSAYPTKKELNITFNIPSKTTITSITQQNGLLGVETVNSDFQLSAKDGEFIKSIASAENGTLSATYKKLATCDVTCNETEYIKRIKLSEDDVQIEKAQHVNYWPMRSCLEAIYPIGAIYLATTSYCPLQNIWGMSWRWVQVSQDRVLQGSNGTNAGTTIEAGLPSITGYFSIRHNGRLPGTSDAFYIKSLTSAPGVHFEECGKSACYGVAFDAGRSNSIYGKSTTVQPPAYTVTVWKRVS